MHESPAPAHPSFLDLVGLTVGPVDDGKASGSVEVTDDHLNPHGYLHGGVVFTLVDTVMGAAVMSVLADGSRCVSGDVHLRFLRPVVAGRIASEAEVVHRGRRTAVVEAVVRDDEGRTVAFGDASFAIVPA